MEKIKKHKKIIIHCVLIFVALFFVLLFAKEKYFYGTMSAYTTKEITKGGSEKRELREEDGILTQDFVVTTEVLWGLGLNFERRQNKPQGEIEMIVTDETGAQLYQGTTPIRDIQNDDTYWISFAEIIEDSKDKVITLSLQVRDIANGDTLRVFTDTKGNIKVGQIYAQNAYLVKMFWAFALIISLFIYGLYFALYIKKLQIEIIFLLFVIFAGMMYAFLVKPGAVPDESAHYATAYAHSNIIMGKTEELRAEVLMDDIDYEFYKSTRNTEPSLSAYRDFQTNFLRREVRGEMVAIDRWPINTPGYLYAGQIVGVTLGRLGGLNGLTTFYLGRFLNVLVLSVLLFLAMKKLPSYKMSMFVLCLFPMTAHLLGSFSYDGMILALSLVLVSHIMELAFGKQTEHRVRELIIIAVACVLLGGCKGGAYIPLLGLLCLLPMRCFKEKKQRIMFGGGVAICTMAMFVLTAATAIGSSIGSSEATSQTTTYYVGWIFENPMKFLQLLSNTVATQSGDIFDSLIGSSLGWFNIPITSILVFSFAGIFAMSCVYVQGNQDNTLLMKRQKIIIGISLILSVAMIVAGMMFSWTNIGSPAIEGIQGRYFLPLLLPLVFCLKNTNLTLEKSLDKEMIFAMAWLHVMVFVSVWGVAFSTTV